MAKVHTDKEFDDLMAAAFEESVVPYIEAVASTIEGRADGRAWHDFELVTARAILLSYLLGLSQVIEDAEIAGADFFSDKATYAKSGCGANAEGGGGFQPGNTCAGDGDGKAEPGESRHKTSTPEFKAWFGESKVVDDDGEPLVMYHGTGKAEGFDEFNPDMTGLGADQLGSGFYFTTDPSEASLYTTQISALANPSDAKLGGDSSPGVLPVYLSIQNPLKVKGSNLRDVDIDLTPSQAEAIIRYSPDLYHPDDSPIGNWHDIWDEGLQDWMITDVSVNYAGQSFMSL